MYRFDIIEKHILYFGGISRTIEENLLKITIYSISSMCTDEFIPLRGYCTFSVYTEWFIHVVLYLHARPWNLPNTIVIVIYVKRKITQMETRWERRKLCSSRCIVLLCLHSMNLDIIKLKIYINPVSGINQLRSGMP